MADAKLDAFVQWFEQNNGFIDKAYMGFNVFPPSQGGRGAIALQNIPASPMSFRNEGHNLFTIPRSLVISTRTSSLSELFGPEEWKQRKLDQGWVGLILCMMWEESQGSSSKWGPYLGSLPTEFSTPMFWNDADLGHLKGTTVVEKLGREDAKRNFTEILTPAVQSRPDIFTPSALPVHYSLQQYHIMGSRILSRSFNVEKWESDNDENEEANNSHSMDVDEPETVATSAQDSEPTEEHVEEEEEEDEEDSSDVSMVPVADLLNARFESENASTLAKLFYEEHELKMVATKPIACGEQIASFWNTYGDLPNAELLRRYGHVDLLPLPNGNEGNPGDVVELRADLVVASVAERKHVSSSVTEERIEWWLEEGGDDVLELDSDLEIPPALISLVKLISLSPDDWPKLKSKGKPPKPKLDQEVLARRLAQYATSVQDDEKALSGELALNERNAIVVRLGEKRIVEGLLSKLKKMAGESTKRKRPDGTGSSPKNKRSKK
ncbi:SET domain-containing protein [Hymenopellis radicata]|nr:SET domain-containing protein [Hymenopellis radicata]